MPTPRKPASPDPAAARLRRFASGSAGARGKGRLWRFRRALSACGAALGLAVSPAGGQPPPGLAAQKSGGDVVLSLTGAPGSGGTIQYRSGLSASNTWHYLAHFAALSASPCQVTEPGALHAARFYRAFSYSLPTNVVPRSNMVWVAPGVFVMGSPAGEALRAANETQHTVTLTRGFYMNQYEVTQGEYLALMGTNPSRFTTQDYNGNPISPDLSRPVEQVSWLDATNYCGQLTSQERTAGRLPAGWRYRLPTEAEWEYACRAGTATAFSFGNAIRGGAANFQNHYEYDAGIGDLYVPGPEVPWRACTTAVGSYPPNAWGLYDLHGNVWEWCQDWLGTYPAGSVTDPQGPASGSGRVYRGGSWDYWGRYSRSACRFSLAPSKQYDFIGFRVVLAPDP